MADEVPLIFRKRLGSLRPANQAAEKALAAIDGTVRVRITQVSPNVRRMGFYWIMLAVAAEALNEHPQFDGQLDAESLHRLLKHKLELGKWMQLPSGERWLDVDSISFGKMSEPERAAWVDRVAAILSRWLSVPIEDLMNEARAREAA
jgi:hypothetical protein